MNLHRLSRCSDSALLAGLHASVARDRVSTAELVAYVAEVDARALYRPAACDSMHAYCVRKLHFSEDVASKRIRAGRAVREFPVLLGAIADGRLHLSGVVMLAPHLTAENVEGLIAAATHRSKAEIEQLLAERFPQPELMGWVAGPGPGAEGVSAPGRMHEVAGPAAETPEVGATGSSAPGRITGPASAAKVAPLSGDSFGLQVTIGRGTHEKLRYAQSLLRDRVPSGDVAEVLDRALDALVRELEKRKFAATSRPRAPRPPRRPEVANPRRIPSEVKRAVWGRDGGRCTFVGEDGDRCEARERLEFDHVEPVARGGGATVGNLRLRCRTHNQLEAERTYGTEFMRHKRQARQAAAARRSDASAAAAAPARGETGEDCRQAAEEVIPWLRQLGFRMDEARRAAALCERIPGAPLEERVRLALTCFAKPRNWRSAGTPEAPNGPC